VRAEADQPEHHERRQRHHGPRQHAPALAPAPRGQHHERQHHPGRDLHAHARDHCDGALAQPGGFRARPPAGVVARGGGGSPCPCLPAGGERHGRCQRGHHQRVVVGPAHRQLQQHGVQPHERHRPLPRAPEHIRAVADERDRCQAGDRRDRLQRPHAPGKAQRRQRIAAECEQRAVGRVLEGPPHEREHRIRGRFRGHVRVRVEPVQGAQPRVAEVPEHILGDQRRAEQQDHVRGHDRAHQRARRHRPCTHQHQPVGGAHQQGQVLEAVAAQRRGQARQRPRQPGGPPAGARGHVLRGGAGGARAQQQHAREDPEQPERPQRPCAARRAHRRGRAGPAPATLRDTRRRYRCGRLQGLSILPPTRHGMVLRPR